MNSRLSGEIGRARQLLERGDASGCVRALREAERVAIAQRHPEARPLIAALAREAAAQGDTRTFRRAQRLAATNDGRRPAPARIAGGVQPIDVEGMQATPTPGRRHPDGRVIAAIWVVLVVAGLAAAALLPDDDPNTDNASGAGALVAIVGVLLTFVYVVGSALLGLLRRR